MAKFDSFDKLTELLEAEGYTSLDEFILVNDTDERVPGICGNFACSFTKDVHRDERHGWCDRCGTESVTSGLVIAQMLH